MLKFFAILTLSFNPYIQNLTKTAVETAESGYCMAEAIHFEARGESLLGKEAVASVILNRVDHIHYDETICDVVYQDYQFSYTLQDNREFILNNKKDRDSFIETLSLSMSIVAGTFDSRIPNINHYFAHNKVSPIWRHRAKHSIRIGNHTFMEL